MAHDKFSDAPLAFNADELYEIIANLRTKKAPGADRINNRMIKNLPNCAIDFLIDLFNACCDLYYWPDDYKFATVIPIKKSGKNESLIESYRPISLLPAIAKLFERLLLAKLKDVVAAKSIVPPNQYGFKDHHAAEYPSIWQRSCKSLNQIG